MAENPLGEAELGLNIDANVGGGEVGEALRSWLGCCWRAAKARWVALRWPKSNSEQDRLRDLRTFLKCSFIASFSSCS